MAKTEPSTIVSFKGAFSFTGKLEPDDPQFKDLIFKLQAMGCKFEGDSVYITWNHSNGSSSFGPAIKVTGTIASTE